VSLPLQLCDLAALVAAGAMITDWRPLRALLYFWGIGLSTQAFISPIIQAGPNSLRFWMFFVSHTMIVGSAIYDLIVRGYRPRGRDALLAMGVTAAYSLSMFLLDIYLSRAVGVQINYGFVGNTTPDNPTIMNKLGPWPLRVLILALIVIAGFTMLWAVWPLSRRLTRPPGRATS
jgi:hypothetical integral membrane protein (TIGR02206 family)